MLSCQVLNKRVLCTTHLTQRRDGTQPVPHRAAFCTQARGIFPCGRNDPLPYQKAGNEVAPSQEKDLVERLWGRFDQLDAERQQDDQLASVRRWGESCCPCLPKGQRITHVPVSRWKGKFPQACLISISILNPSLAPLQVWVLVEELLCRKTIQKSQSSQDFLSLQQRKGDI